MLDITIWEAPPAVLFGGALSSTGSGNAQQTKLPEQMVSSSGTISVPFIGDVSVLGKTPVQVQNIIKGRLKKRSRGLFHLPCDKKLPEKFLLLIFWPLFSDDRLRFYFAQAV